MSSVYTDPDDDYALPKRLTVHDEWVPWAGYEEEQEQALNSERELVFDEPRWGDMGGEDE